MNEKDFERKEKARLDEMYDAITDDPEVEIDDDFDNWWEHEENMTSNNPYQEGGVLFWAWEGWVAGRKAEREACAKLTDKFFNTGRNWAQLAAAIRAGEKNE
jgi:hypothetical protein